MHSHKQYRFAALCGSSLHVAFWLLALCMGAAGASRDAAAQGTATLTPLFPARGATATVSFTATGGPLAAASGVTATVGFNGFQNIRDVPLSGAAPAWSGSFVVPSNATSIDIVFKNTAGTIFDNNGGNGVDWEFLVAETQATSLGTTKTGFVQGDGFLFKLWAPDIARAAVVGEFNGWATRADLMVRDPATGVWYAHVTNAAAGQEYKFLLDGTEYRRDPRGRQVRGNSDNSVLVDPAVFAPTQPRPGTQAAFRDWVVYEAHVGSLSGSGGTPGTFTGLAPTRLDYLATLGVNAILLMPINEFPGAFSGGYNVTDPFAIEQSYGTPAQFAALVEACHARGIAVIVDVVHNHYGPDGLDLYDFQNLDRDAVRDNPDIYFYSGDPSLAQTPFGPRPNYAAPQVRAFIKDAIRMFVSEYKVDGIRWDFTKAIRGRLDAFFNISAGISEGVSLLQDINSTVLNTDPDLFSVAEDLTGDPRLTSPVANISGNPNDGFGFNSQWDVAFHYAIVGQLVQPDEAEIDLGTVTGAVNGTFKRMHYIESHDEVWKLNSKTRVPARFDNANPESLRARKLAGLSAALLFTSPGTPMVFQGGELLDFGAADRAWDVNEPIDFSRLKSDPKIAAFHSLYRDLIRLRRNLDGVSAGLLGEQTTVFHVNDAAKVFAYIRGTGENEPGDRVVVLVNLSGINYAGGYEIGLPQSGTWYQALNSDRTAYGSDFGGIGSEQEVKSIASPMHGFAQRGKVAIGARSVVILTQGEPPPKGTTTWTLR